MPPSSSFVIVQMMKFECDRKRLEKPHSGLERKKKNQGQKKTIDFHEVYKNIWETKYFQVDITVTGKRKHTDD